MLPYIVALVVGVFFFQAEDGIRDGHVTGVQTCALPICVAARVLNNLGVSLNKARQQVLRLLGSNESQSGRQGRGQASNASTPTLDSLAKDLTASARDGHVDPVIGRDKEIERVIQVLSRRTKNNPVLIGEPGVGKTAIAEGLAQI